MNYFITLPFENPAWSTFVWGGCGIGSPDRGESISCKMVGHIESILAIIKILAIIVLLSAQSETGSAW
jgi:hypothetical protein